MTLRRIHKFAVKPGEFKIEMPDGAKILSVQAQYENPCMWALVDPKMKMVIRRFKTVPTGADIDWKPSTVYLGTIQLSGGSFVFHLLELTDKT